MNSGYDQFFKNARKASGHGKATSMADLRSKIKLESKKKKKNQKTFYLAFLCFLGLGLSFAGTYYFDAVESFFRKIEVRAFSTVFAEENPKSNSQTKSDPTKRDPAKNEASKDTKSLQELGNEDVQASNDKKEFSQEEINHFAKLNERKKELDLREDELQKMEQELSAQREALEKRMKEVENVRQNVSTALEEKIKGDDKKVETLVQMFSTMKAQQAAKVFETMDEDLAIEILGRMKKKNAAEIMNLVKPEKTQIFSERFAGYRKK